MDEATAGDGQSRTGYLSTESQSAYGVHRVPVWEVFLPRRRQTWIGDDGSGLRREWSGPASFFCDEGKARWEAAGSPELPGGYSQTVFAPGCMAASRSKARIGALAADPAVLGPAITARKIVGGPPGPEEDFVLIGEMLRTPGISAELSHALYQVAEQLPRVQILGPLSDRLGRPARALAMPVRTHLRELVFDRDTYLLLGEQETLTDPSITYAPLGTITGWAVYLPTRHVDALPSDAPPIPGPPCRAGEEAVRRKAGPEQWIVTGPPGVA